MPGLDTARSWLFVPASRPERIAKARNSGAHAVIVDLEDAVPPDDKPAARAAAAAALAAGAPLLVRINAAGTPWFEDDVRMVAAASGIAGIVLPKAEDPATLDHIAAALPGLVVMPLIETARGLADAQRLACHASTGRLLFGSLDFCLDLGLDAAGEDDLLYFRSRLVLASRLAGRPPPVDGVTTTIDDAEALAADVARARRQGFGGKLCIHPVQIAAVNGGFAPAAGTVAWARRVVAAADREGGGAVVLDGCMVDRPVVERARRVLMSHEH